MSASVPAEFRRLPTGSPAPTGAQIRGPDPEKGDTVAAHQSGERGTDSEPLRESPRPGSGPVGPTPEDEPGEPGAEGGSGSPAADLPPGWPAGDDSPLGDTDQHSDA